MSSVEAGGRRVLVLDSDWDQTPYLVRTLAEAGFSVTLAGPMIIEATGLGRYCRHVAMCTSADPSFAARVIAVLRNEAFDVVMPTNELGLQKLWDLPDPFAGRVFPQTTAAQRAALSDRQRVYELALGAGPPIPKSSPLPSAAALASAVETLGFPLVIRGTQGTSGQQVRVVGDPASLERAFEEIRAVSPGTPFAQQFIPGPRVLVGALVDRGRVVQMFAQQTLECFPAGTGPSIRVVSIESPRLTEYASKFFSSLGWTGLGCAEFISTGSDFVFLEFNPRPWAAIMAAERCGIPFFRMLGAYLQGEREFQTRRPTVGRECVLFPQYFYARLRRPRQVRLADLGRYARSLYDAPWRSRPLLYHYLRRIWWLASGPTEAKETGGNPETGPSSTGY